ncbi:UNVERIFIED_CONTAM: hypothetical protein K2H54_042707 [Gekko kuhli]
MGSQPASSTPPPPAPRLSLSPPYSIFAPGERIQLKCSPPERRGAEEFQFYKRKPGGQWDQQTQQEKDTWELEVSTAHLGPNSTFVCSYNERNGAGERIQSAQSNQCVVSIVELPPAALSLDPKYPVYINEEWVTLTCSAPEGRQVSGYLFYKELQDRTLRELPHPSRGRYVSLWVNQSTAGKYRCAYWIQLSGRGIWSPRSGPVSVAMTDSQHLLVTWDNFTHTIRLWPQDGGRYSCKYQVVESEREIPSLTSNVISISVMAGTVPGPSTAVMPVHTYETTAGVTDSPGAPESPALQLTSSQPSVEENSHSDEPDGPATSLPRSSQPTLHDGISSSTDSQVSKKPLDSRVSTKPLDSRVSTKPLDSRVSTKPLDSQVSTKPSNSRVSTKPVDSRVSTKPSDSPVSTYPLDSRSTTKLFNSQDSRTTFTNSGDARSTSQTRTVSESDNGNGSPLYARRCLFQQ